MPRRARPRSGSATFFLDADIDLDSRDEAFPDLWSARPDLALRLATEGRIDPVAILGLRVCRADAAACAALDAAAIGRLLGPTLPAVAAFGLEIARERLARGGADPELLAVLVQARFPEARMLALRRIEAEADLPWSNVALAFALLTSAAPEVEAALLQLARERDLPAGVAGPLAERLVAWLRAMPPVLDAEAAASVRAMRAGLPLLWPNHDMPVPGQDIAALMAHPAPEMMAAGVALLALSGTDADGLPAEQWYALIGSDSLDVRDAAIGLLSRLDDERLRRHADPILAFASGPSPVLRKAARPLVKRLVDADPGQRRPAGASLIASLFRTAPDDRFVADIVALLGEAMPGELAALDAGTLWRLLQAQAKGRAAPRGDRAGERAPGLFSVRQIARLGGHSHSLRAAMGDGRLSRRAFPLPGRGGRGRPFSSKATGRRPSPSRRAISRPGRGRPGRRRRFPSSPTASSRRSWPSPAESCAAICGRGWRMPRSCASSNIPRPPCTSW